jgi:hypothetical protein
LSGRRRALRAGLALALLLAAGLAVPAAFPGRGGGGAVARDGSPAASPESAAYDSTRGDSVGEAALYLSWGAPHGMPGARQDIAISCRDSSRVDTLYLSLETGRDLPRFFSLFGRIVLRPALGDSLGAFWDFGERGANRGSLLVQMDADGTFPCAQPWLHPGIGVNLYEFAPGRAELMTIYAVKPEDAAPFSGRTRYCFARLLLKHRRCGLPGAQQPVCIEWTEAEYSGGGPDIPVQRGPGRFASVNSADGSVCTPWRRMARLGAWRPPALAPAPSAPRARAGGRAQAGVRAPADSTGR